MKIIIPFKAISVNDAYCADRRFGLKKSAKDWTYQVNWVLDGYKHELRNFKEQYDETCEGLIVEITYIYENLYNKAGGISAKTYDLSNSDKLLIDLVIDAAHFGAAPYKSPNLNINDKNIIRLTSTKQSGPSDSIEINISKMPLI